MTDWIKRVDPADDCDEFPEIRRPSEYAPTRFDVIKYDFREEWAAVLFSAGMPIYSSPGVVTQLGPSAAASRVGNRVFVRGPVVSTWDAV